MEKTLVHVLQQIIGGFINLKFTNWASCAQLHVHLQLITRNVGKEGRKALRKSY